MRNPALPTSDDHRTDLSGRVAIITGAGQGIGRVYAHRFAEAGASVVIAELNAESGQNVCTEIVAKGHQALAVSSDVTSATSVQAMIDRTMAAFGRIDILVNNAAIYSRMTRATFDELPRSCVQM